MVFGLDYDGTYTSAPGLWLKFIKNAQAEGHTVMITTMRYPSECDGSRGTVDPRLRELSVPFVCTSRQAKKEFCRKLGLMVHVWIDDHPEAVYQDASALWADVAPEGEPVVPEYP